MQQKSRSFGTPGYSKPGMFYLLRDNLPLEVRGKGKEACSFPASEIVQAARGKTYLLVYYPVSVVCVSLDTGNI